VLVGRWFLGESATLRNTVERVNLAVHDRPWPGEVSEAERNMDRRVDEERGDN
jgi:hypothetical protein